MVPVVLLLFYFVCLWPKKKVRTKKSSNNYVEREGDGREAKCYSGEKENQQRK